MTSPRQQGNWPGKCQGKWRQNATESHAFIRRKIAPCYNLANSLMDTPLKKAFLLFCGVWAIYFLCAAGYIDTIDADASVETAKSILFHRKISVQPERPDKMIYAKGTEAKLYTKMGLGTPLLYVPVLALVKGIQPYILWPWPWETKRITAFAISLVNGFLSALIVALVFYYFTLHGISTPFALTLSLSLAFATMLFPYSKSSHREPLQALCLLGAFIFPSLAQPSQLPLRMWFLGGFFFGLGLLTKFALLPVLLPAFFLALSFRPSKKYWMAFLIPLLCFLFLHFLFCYVAFGNGWGTGYSRDVTQWSGRAWSTPFWRGVWLQTLDPQSGFIFYNPVGLLIVGWCIAKLILRSWNRMDTFLGLSILLQLAIHARWWSPTGNNALGPRYLITILPLCALFFHPIPAIPSLPRMTKHMLAIFLVCSVLFQLVQVSIKPQEYWLLRDKHRGSEPTPHWMANFKLFKHKATGQTEKYQLQEFGIENSELDLSEIRSLQGYNFWWAHWLRLNRSSQSLSAFRAP